MVEIVAYYRVSTQSQGFDGLGMASQRNSIAGYAHRLGAEIVGSYEEVETARRDSLKNRPQLRAALAHARRTGATLVIARIDRLARSVLVTAELMASGVDFIACDNPHANRLTIQILAAMAEHESRLISERVKASVAIRRARGDVFRCTHQLTPEARRKGQIAAAIANRERTRAAYADLAPIVADLRSAGGTLRAIADELNTRGQRTSAGSPWTSAGIYRMLKRDGLTHLSVPHKRHAPITAAIQRVGTRRAGELRTERAHAAYITILPPIAVMHADGKSAVEIATQLNISGQRTQRGGMWSSASILGLLRREGIAEPSRQGGRDFSPAVRAKGIAAAAIAKRRTTSARCLAFMPLVMELRACGCSWETVARSLNASGHNTARGNLWTTVAIKTTAERELYRLGKDAKSQ